MCDQNVLYLGMSGDILSPVFLFPKFTTLYAICKRSNHFEIKDRTWDQLKDDIYFSI